MLGVRLAAACHLLGSIAGSLWGLPAAAATAASHTGVAAGLSSCPWAGDGRGDERGELSLVQLGGRQSPQRQSGPLVAAAADLAEGAMPRSSVYGLCGKDWLHEEAGLQLAVQHPVPELAAGVSATVVVHGLDRDGARISGCPEHAEKLTLWAALIGRRNTTEATEPAAIEPVPGECAWRVSFTPREADLAYDLHVRTTWWNIDRAEPAYHTAQVRRDQPCPDGTSRLRVQTGWQFEGQEELELTGVGSGELLCIDMCTADSRCKAFSYRYSGDLQHTGCALYSSPGNATQDPGFIGLTVQELTSGTPGLCFVGHPKSDKDAWRYLGGWSILQSPLKDEACHARSHVAGSPLALGTAAAAPTASNSTSGRRCSSGREPGRFVQRDGAAPRWEPAECELPDYATRADVDECFQRRNLSSVHFSGDSLLREQFMNLQGYISGPDQLRDEREFDWLRPDGVPVHVTYNGYMSPDSFESGKQVFVSNMQAQWLAWKKSTAEIEEDVSQLAQHVAAQDGSANDVRQDRLFFAAVYPHSMRQSYITPPRMARLNAAVDRLLGPVGFRVLDVYNASRLAGNQSYDGMHLGDGTAHQMGRILLGMICEGERGSRVF